MIIWSIVGRYDILGYVGIGHDNLFDVGNYDNLINEGSGCDILGQCS